MTGPTPDNPEAPAATLPGPPVPPGPPIPPITPPVGRRSIFSLEGRAAAGLYLVGWLGTGFGVALFLVSISAQSTGIAGLGLTLGAAILLSLGLIAAAGAQGAQRRADGVAGYAGPSPFLVFAASLAVTVLIVIVVVGGASLAGLDALSPLGALVQVAITGLVYAGLVQLLIVSPGALTWSEMGVRALPPARIAIDVLWGASFAIPVIFVTTIVAAVLIGALGTQPDSPLPPSRDSAGLLLNLISAALLAPIGEEIFYRGFALTAWARAMDQRAALIRSAVFFAFVHILTVGAATFDEGAAQALIAFAVRVPIALGLGWVFLRRGSLYAAIGLHAAFNGILLLLAQTVPAAPPA